MSRTISRLRFGGFVVAALVAAAGCAGSAATQAPGPAAVVSTVAPVRTPGALATPATLEEQVAAACSGATVDGATPYGGSVHPVLVVTGGDVQRADSQRFSFNSARDKTDWLTAEWSSPLQLVVCAGATERMRIDSCGDYMNSYGQSYEVVRYRLVIPVTVVEAATGKIIRTARLPGSDPAACTQTVQSFDLIGDDPDVYGYAIAASER